MKTADMSPEAIMRRLRQVGQLRELCLALMKATPISKEEANKLREQRKRRKVTSQNS